MLEFKMIQELKPNDELLEIIKNYNYTIKNEKKLEQEQSVLWKKWL